MAGGLWHFAVASPPFTCHAVHRDGLELANDSGHDRRGIDLALGVRIHDFVLEREWRVLFSCLPSTIDAVEPTCTPTRRPYPDSASDPTPDLAPIASATPLR